MNETEWKEIPGFSGYMVNKQGDVLSHKRKRPRILTPLIHNKRVSYVSLQYNELDAQPRTSLSIPIARLVLRVFDRSPKDGEIAEHIDGDFRNNALSNLRWSRWPEHTGHRKNLGRLKGSPVIQSDKTGDIARFPSIVAAAAHFKTKPTNIRSAAAGRSKTAKGFFWRYADA